MSRGHAASTPAAWASPTTCPASAARLAGTAERQVPACHCTQPTGAQVFRGWCVGPLQLQKVAGVLRPPATAPSSVLARVRTASVARWSFARLSDFFMVEASAGSVPPRRARRVTGAFAVWTTCLARQHSRLRAPGGCPAGARRTRRPHACEEQLSAPSGVALDLHAPPRMKKHSAPIKLTLGSSTIRTLREPQLAAVAGGASNPSSPSNPCKGPVPNPW